MEIDVGIGLVSGYQCIPEGQAFRKQSFLDIFLSAPVVLLLSQSIHREVIKEIHCIPRWPWFVRELRVVFRASHHHTELFALGLISAKQQSVRFFL